MREIDPIHAAYHEAGHAVILESAGVTVRWVTVENDGISGYCRHAFPGCITNIEDAFKQGTFALCGALAEQRYRTGGDAEKWAAALEWKADREEEDIEFIRSELEGGMEDEDGLWGDAYDVHKCLLMLEESSRYGTLSECIEALVEHAGSVVVEQWQSIEAVAGHLLRERYLEGQDVRDIIEGVQLTR